MSLIFPKLEHKHLVWCQFHPNHVLHAMKLNQSLLLNTVCKIYDVLSNSRDVPYQSGTPYTDAVKSKKMQKDGHIKRPLNCFMLYSFHERAKVKQMHPTAKHQEISKILGKQWKALSDNEQEKYRKASKILKEMHDIEFPSYQYKPTRRGRVSAGKMKCASKGATEKTATCTKFINQNPGTGNSLHLCNRAAIGNLNDVTGVQPMPLLIWFTPKEPLERQPLQKELPHWETLQTLPPLPDGKQLPLSFDIAATSAGEDALMEWIRNTNKELDEKQSKSPLLPSLQTQ